MPSRGLPWDAAVIIGVPFAVVGLFASVASLISNDSTLIIDDVPPGLLFTGIGLALVFFGLRGRKKEQILRQAITHGGTDGENTH